MGWARRRLAGPWGAIAASVYRLAGEAARAEGDFSTRGRFFRVFSSMSITSAIFVGLDFIVLGSLFQIC